MRDGTAWILGGAMTALALLGLVMASRATDPMIYYVGLGFCLFGLLFNYGMIARHTGKSEE